MPCGSGGREGSRKADNYCFFIRYPLADVDHFRWKSEVQIDVGWNGIANRDRIGRSGPDAGQQCERPEDAHLAEE